MAKTKPRIKKTPPVTQEPRRTPIGVYIVVYLMIALMFLSLATLFFRSY